MFVERLRCGLAKTNECFILQAETVVKQEFFLIFYSFEKLDFLIFAHRLLRVASLCMCYHFQAWYCPAISSQKQSML